MRLPATHSVLCPLLVGRAAYLDVLNHQITQVRNGYGTTVLLAGEAGIGKSRLAAETKSLAIHQGFDVWQGHCFEPDRVLPYAPLLDLLHTLWTTQPPAALTALLQPYAADLIKLLPELRTLCPTLPTGAPGEPEQEKRQLFQTLVRFFVQRTTPLLLLIEDLHWCDEASLEFFLLLTRQLATRPVLLVMTYRNDEVNVSLGRLLATLDRQRLAHELTLTRLTVTETDAMLRAIFKLTRAPQADFLTALYELTEGNPFFIEEVLNVWVTEGMIFQTGGQWGRKPLSQIAIPRTVQLAVQQRVAQLTPPAQRLLTLAAVAGQRYDFDLLLRASGHDERTLIGLIKELVAAQLVTEETPDHFAFRHALTRQAVYAGLLARERRLLHRTVAETLESMPAASTLRASLAYHFEAAEVWEKTLRYARRAGEQAQALQAPRAAVEQWTRALTAAQHLDQSLPLDLLQARGQALEMLGDFAAARADLEAVLKVTQQTTDLHREWQALFDLGFLWTSRDFEQAGRYFQRALTLARRLDEPTILAQTLNRIGNWHVNMGQPHEGRSYHEQALALFQAADDQPGMAATLDLLAGAAHFGGDIQQGMTYYRQAAGHFRQLGDQRGLSSTLSWLAWQCATALNLTVVVASLVECRQHGEEALQLARQIQWRPGEAFAMLGLAFVTSAAGSYGEALTFANTALAITEDLQHGWATVAGIALGAIYLDLGDFPAAQSALENAVTLSQQWHIGFGMHNANVLLALAYVRQGATAVATVLLADKFGDQALPESAEQPARLTLPQRLYWWVRAELALQQGDATSATAIARTLIVAAPPADGEATRLVARLWLLLAQAEIAGQQLESAETTLQRARQAAIRQTAQPILWRVEALLGHLQQKRGERQLAEQHFTAARHAIETLAATMDAPAQRERFCAYALAHLPAPPTDTPLRAAKAAFAGLTERERQVAALIAQGKSDREIAEVLVLSKRTASTHVTNILNKLGFSARSQIAAWAVAKGL